MSSTRGSRGASATAFGIPAFVRLFMADTLSTIGSVVSALALQFVLIDSLDADQQAIGLVRMAQWLPYIVLGLAAGVIVDRVRRLPLLIGADIACFVIFGAIGLLALTGRLTVPLLAALVFVVGAVSCFSVAAYQSFLPRLVPNALLPDAFSRLEQMGSTVHSVGPLASGVLVRLVGAPVGVLVDAVSYAASAVALMAIRVDEPRVDRAGRRHVLTELREGARWVYRHQWLAPYAIWLHLVFVFDAIVTTIFVFFANQELGLDPVAIGLILAVAGVSGVIGARLAPGLAQRFGLGPVVTVVEWLTPVSALVILCVQPGPFAVAVLVAAFFINGFTSITSTLTMSLRSAITPDRLRARMNATIRTFNWGGLAIAAGVSGWLASSYGNRMAIGVGFAGLLGATVYLNVSGFRQARMPSDPHA